MRNLRKKKVRRPLVKRTPPPIKLDFDLFISFAMLQKGISFGSFFASRGPNFPIHFKSFLGSVSKEKYPTMKDCFNWSVSNPNCLIEDWIKEHGCYDKLTDEIMDYNDAQH